MNPFNYSIKLRGIGASAAAFLLLAAGLSAPGCGPGEEAAMQQDIPLFSAETVQQAGKTVVVLRRGGDHPVEARIAPSAGANLFSLVYDGRELIYGPENLAEFDGSAPGNPVLYPTPNRVAGGTFTFEGRTFDFGTNDGDRFLHGLVRDKAWDYELWEADSQGVSVECWIDFAAGTEIFDKFGFPHRLSLLYTLDDRGLRIRYRVDNRGEKTIPYGIAFHPYFNFLGERDSAFLCVPAEQRMVAEDLMPTGELAPVDGTPYDITEPTSVPELVLDDVYYGMAPENPAYIEYRQAGIRVTLEASMEFTHMVVYIQPQNPFFCVENQTCSTDAHNLHAQGYEDAAHLLFAPPGGASEGWVHYVLQPLD